MSDPEAMLAYSKLAGPAIKALGGRVLARGNPLAVFEAGKHERVVVIEWDSLEKAKSVYRYAGYQKAVAELRHTVVRDIRIIAALE